MITGVHAILYAPQVEKVRAFLGNTLGLTSVDAGGGWLIFALPPSEIAPHPLEAGEQPSTELFLMCDDLDRTVAELRAKGVTFTEGVTHARWGSITRFEVPGYGTMALYQPRHPRP